VDYVLWLSAGASVRRRKGSNFGAYPQPTGQQGTFRRVNCRWLRVPATTVIDRYSTSACHPNDDTLIFVPDSAEKYKETRLHLAMGVKVFLLNVMSPPARARHQDLGRLEGDRPTVAHDPGPDLDQPHYRAIATDEISEIKPLAASHSANPADLWPVSQDGRGCGPRVPDDNWRNRHPGSREAKRVLAF
jgi:hypothetical protein